MSCFASARLIPSRLYIFGVPRYTFLQCQHFLFKCCSMLQTLHGCFKVLRQHHGQY